MLVLHVTSITPGIVMTTRDMSIQRHGTVAWPAVEMDIQDTQEDPDHDSRATQIRMLFMGFDT